MRTTITMDDDVHQLALMYAKANGISLSAAIDQLIRKGQDAALSHSAPPVRRSPEGLPLLPRRDGGVITYKMVKDALEEDFA